ncbi:methyltransferase [Mucilaginibacter sabulilitoris]|uniref:tRNA1(Val) (adenine(37)-N6)-methyltransferase n=1 Tax=Mucilaginibacter sabulilitoris TaxID=1173583 RepID=A0ABZ0TXL7_9SPHI|nr:methyltransferase [Mucilaginibacter sabulilitoris]WPU96215.1 methyltransferase [Mucilaginibacter sabulilitoris]
MKINTDGVLLGALADFQEPSSILDIGTGTGVIALMLAQRFLSAQIDAVEIDKTAASTAMKNFENSPFVGRLTLYPYGFEDFFAAHPDKKYDLIVSNPPFYINSLQSPGAKKTLAKHTDKAFFDQLMHDVSAHITTNGVCWLILPTETAVLVKQSALQYGLYPKKIITLHSFKADAPHREILALGFDTQQAEEEQFVIYDAPKVYGKEYQEVLKEFLTIF